MDSCCIIYSNLVAEQLNRNALRDDSLVIRNFNYTELFNEIISKWADQEMSKENLKQLLFPLFLDANKTQSNDFYIE